MRRALRRPAQPLNWHVAVTDGGSPFGHVMAFAFDGRSWIVVDPHFRWTEVFTLAPGAEFDAWLAPLRRESRIWRLEGRGEAPGLPGWFCVAQVKRLVGLRSGALSPRGLERDLRRAGATRVFAHENQDPAGRPALPVRP